MDPASINIVEKLIAGTIGTTAVLGFAAWLLWNRLNMREAQHSEAMERKDQLFTGVIEKSTTAIAALQISVAENTRATETLREAIRSNSNR
jgi:hypothetical protein